MRIVIGQFMTMLWKNVVISLINLEFRRGEKTLIRHLFLSKNRGIEANNPSFSSSTNYNSFQAKSLPSAFILISTNSAAKVNFDWALAHELTAISFQNRSPSCGMKRHQSQCSLECVNMKESFSVSFHFGFISK